MPGVRFQVSGSGLSPDTRHLTPDTWEDLVMLKIGDKAPAFSLPSDSGDKISLDAFQGKTLVLFFFPKADTPG
jgi:peroxiredoxin Q/BCP